MNSDGSIKPIVDASRMVLPTKKNYFVIEMESLGIVLALMKFHRFIHRRRFTLQMDHRPLLAILGSKKGLPAHTANRLQQWGTILLNYDFRMEFLSSSKLCHADELSRLILQNSEPLEDMVIASLQMKIEINEILCRNDLWLWKEEKIKHRMTILLRNWRKN